jgi:cytoskeletal protein RodZ
LNSPLADIGAELRQARESQQRTIDDLSHVTLIHVRHLVALEDGREADLPEPFYVKNFVRKYANALGLPGDAMANRYWDTRPLPEHPPRTAAAPDFMVPWWVFPAMLGALLLGAITTFAVMSGKPSSTAGSPEPGVAVATGSAETGTASGSAGMELAGASGSAEASGSDLAAADASASTDPASNSAAGLVTGVASDSEDMLALGASSVPSPSPSAPEPSPEPSPTGTPSPVNMPPLVVPGHSIKFQTYNKESAWMQMVADGKEVFSGVIRGNSIRTWTANRSLVVRVGRPGVVTAKLGDRSLGTLGPKDAPVFRRTFLTREGEIEYREARAGGAQPTPKPSPRKTPPAAPLEKSPTPSETEAPTPEPAEDATSSE